MNAIRKKSIKLAGTLSMAAISSVALAQHTDLGTILDKKPEKLGKDQVHAIVSGATIKRTNFNKILNAYVEVTSNVNPNGTVAVMQQTLHGPIRGNGKWRVSAEG